MNLLNHRNRCSSPQFQDQALQILGSLLHSAVTTPQRDTNTASFRILSWDSLAGLLVGGVTASLLAGIGQPLLALG